MRRTGDPPARAPSTSTGSIVDAWPTILRSRPSSMSPGTAMSESERSDPGSVGSPGAARQASVTIERSPAPSRYAVSGRGSCGGRRTAGRSKARASSSGIARPEVEPRARRRCPSDPLDARSPGSRNPRPAASPASAITRIAASASGRSSRSAGRDGGRCAAPGCGADPCDDGRAHVRRRGHRDPGRHRCAQVRGRGPRRRGAGVREELRDAGVVHRRHRVASAAAPCASSASRIRRSPRWSRDFAVPAGIPRAAAVSLSDSPSR